jgi:hypothetical protein
MCQDQTPDPAHQRLVSEYTLWFCLCWGVNHLGVDVCVSLQIMKQLQGEDDLPWEGDQNMAARKKLGMFRQPILSLLRRDPAERSTLANFCQTCQQVFTATDHGLIRH